MPTRLREGQRPQASDEEAWLARRAAAGDGAAFATLYDRYERRAYNLCYRITGSRDDAADATQETFVKVLERLPHLTGRELQFGPYLLRAARHASYDAIARRRRAVPAAEIHDSAVPVGSGDSDADRPERGALLEAHQEEIRAANETLPPRQREALALRELEELSYDEIAEIMGMNRNSVAQLLSRARIALRDGLRRTALGSIASASPDCERALPLLALRQDGALGHDAASADWLTRHLSACAICPARVAAMEEAGAVYRLWLPLVPALWLRGEAIAHAAEHVGADWSELASPTAGTERRRCAALPGRAPAVVERRRRRPGPARRGRGGRRSRAARAGRRARACLGRRAAGARRGYARGDRDRRAAPPGQDPAGPRDPGRDRSPRPAARGRTAGNPRPRAHGRPSPVGPGRRSCSQPGCGPASERRAGRRSCEPGPGRRASGPERAGRRRDLRGPDLRRSRRPAAAAGSGRSRRRFALFRSPMPARPGIDAAPRSSSCRGCSPRPTTFSPTARVYRALPSAPR